MKYVSEKYERQLADLAETLVTPEKYGELALQGTVEQDAQILIFPGRNDGEVPPAA